jgi:hypothetical protein
MAAPSRNGYPGFWRTSVPTIPERPSRNAVARGGGDFHGTLMEVDLDADLTPT